VTERARLAAIGERAASSIGLDTYFSLCAEMDARLASERQRLSAVAKDARFPLKSEGFALAYYGFGDQIGFGIVSRAGHAGFTNLSGGPEKRQFYFEEMSSGQLHFLMENSHALFADEDAGHLAEELIYVLRERFRWEPYHVQLAILLAAASAYRTPEEIRKRLIEELRSLDISPSNWAINTSIVDALKFLGALDNEAEDTRAEIRRELASVLGNDDDAVDRDLALSLCLRIFDHPFDWVYGEEIYKLEEPLRRRLYRRALGASNIKRCMNLVWLSRQVASFDDASDASVMQPLAILPDPSNGFPQEEWGGLVVATRFLGRHGAELPRVDGARPEDLCLSEIRTLIYNAEYHEDSHQEETRLAWQRLHALSPQLVIGCIAEVHDALTQHHWSEMELPYGTLDFAKIYPTESLRVARRFVIDGTEAQYFRRVPHRDWGPTFAFDTVGRYGDRSDIEPLRKLTFAHPFARYALRAIKLLEGVPDAGC
jgi:hypothetical protein